MNSPTPPRPHDSTSPDSVAATESSREINTRLDAAAPAAFDETLRSEPVSQPEPDGQPQTDSEPESGGLPELQSQPEEARSDAPESRKSRRARRRTSLRRARSTGKARVDEAVEVSPPLLATTTPEKESLRALRNVKAASRPQREASRSRSSGGPLLGQALERARLLSGPDTSPGWVRIDPSADRGLGERVTALEQLREETRRMRAELDRRSSELQETEQRRDHEARQVVQRDQMIADLTERIRETTADIQSLKSEQSTLREALEAASRAMGGQQASVETLRVAFETSAANLSRRDGDVAALRAELAEARTRSEERIAELAELRASQQFREKRATELESELEAQREATRERDERLRDTLAERDALALEFADAQRAAAAAAGEMAGLRDALAAGEETLAEREARLTELAAEAASNQVELRSRDREMQLLLRQLAQSEETLAERNASIQRLESSLEQSRTEHTAAVAALGQSVADPEATAQLEILAAEAQSLQSRLDAEGERSSRLEGELAESTRAQTEALERLAAESHRLQEAESTLAERNSRIGTLGSEVGRLQAILAGSEETARARDRDYGLLERRLASQEDHDRERDTEIAELRRQLARFEDARDQRSERLRELEATVNDQRAAAEAARAERDALRESLASTQRNASAEEEHARRFQEGLANAERTLVDRAREIGRLRENLAAAEARIEALEESKAGSPPAGDEPESLPEVGAGPQAGSPLRLTADDEIRQLREVVERRESEIETLQRVLGAANERNTALRETLSELRDDTPTDSVAPRDGVEVAAANPEPDREPASEPASAAAETPIHFAASREAGFEPDSAEPREAFAPASDEAEGKAGWKLFPWKRPRREPASEAIIARYDTREMAPLGVAPKAFVPSLEAPADSLPPIADALVAPPIYDYWKRSQIRSKLGRPGIASPDDFFLSYLLDVCRTNPGRTNRIVSVGTGSRDLEVVLARRALDAGVRNFNIHCLSDSRSTLSHERAFAAEGSVLGHLTLVQCAVETWPIDDPYALVLINHAFHTFANPAVWAAKISDALEPGGRLLFNGPIGGQDCVDSPVAREIVDQIWQLMPDRYKYSRQLEVLEARYADGDDAGVSTGGASRRAAMLLPILAEHFKFEVFSAFGNVVNAFVDPEIGPNFDPENDRDCRFIDQVASLDDSKIGSGLIAPTHMLAALSREPLERITHSHWTPEFFLAALAGDTEVATPGPDVSSPSLPDPLPDAINEDAEVTPE